MPLKPIKLKERIDKHVASFLKKKDPEQAAYFARKINKRIPQLESLIVKHPQAAQYYSEYVLKKPWAEAEPTILKDLKIAYLYAIFVKKIKWPEIEPLLKKWPREAFVYAKKILKKRWPEAEPYIKKDAQLYEEYKKYFKIK